MISYAEGSELAVNKILIEEKDLEKEIFFVHREAMASMLKQPMFINKIELNLSHAEIVDARIENMHDEIWKANFLIHKKGDIVDGRPDYTDVDFENYMVVAEEALNVEIEDEKFEIKYEVTEPDRGLVGEGWMNITDKVIQMEDLELGKMLAAVITLKEKGTDFNVFTEIAFVFNAGKDLKMWKELMPKLVEKLTGKPAEKNVVQ